MLFSGGIVYFRCVRGICTYMKCLLRQESARDYIDGILSFRRQLTVFVSDIASQVSLWFHNFTNYYYFLFFIKRMTFFINFSFLLSGPRTLHIYLLLVQTGTQSLN